MNVLSEIEMKFMSFSIWFLQLFEYERLISVLLHGVSKTEQEGFVQRIAIYLLNTLACQVDGKQKLFLGELGVVSVSDCFLGYDSDFI